jgi:hypothetical protein
VSDTSAVWDAFKARQQALVIRLVKAIEDEDEAEQIRIVKAKRQLRREIDIHLDIDGELVPF